VITVCQSGQLDSKVQLEINLDDVPALRRVINFKQVAFLRPGGADESSRLSLLMRLLPDTNLKTRLKSALLIQPICHQGHLFGVFLVQPTMGVDDWPASNRQLVDLLAAQVANAMAHASTERGLRVRVGQLEEELERADTADRLAKLEAELKKALGAEQILAQKLGDVRSELAEAKSEIEELTPLISLNANKTDTITRLEEQLAELETELEKGGAGSPLRGCSDPEQVTLSAQELRRPLASISGYTDLLLGESVGTVGELQRLFLQRVKASTERARVLLEDLVQAATFENGLSPLNLEPVQVEDVIEEIIRRLGDQIEIKGLDLEIDLDGSLPLLEMDRDRIEQILYSLISNALQATPSYGKVVVNVRYQIDEPETAENGAGNGGYLFVSVRDSGGGVPLADLAFVFDRHYRAEHPPIVGLGETGMGLPLARELLQAQGGRIWIESESNVGSTLSMVLPATVVQP
jgi:signal transduction histidine kinase